MQIGEKSEIQTVKEDLEKYGGQYVPETLMNAVNELEEAYNHYKDDPEFNKELTDLLKQLCWKTVFTLLCRKN